MLNKALSAAASVYQTTRSTGRQEIILSGERGFLSFYSAFGSGGNDMFFYFIRHRTAPEWEVGTGHLSDAATLVRDTVIASSNNDAHVNFCAGNKDVTNGICEDI